MFREKGSLADMKSRQQKARLRVVGDRVVDRSFACEGSRVKVATSASATNFLYLVIQVAISVPKAYVRIYSKVSEIDSCKH